MSSRVISTAMFELGVSFWRLSEVEKNFGGIIVYTRKKRPINRVKKAQRKKERIIPTIYTFRNEKHLLTIWRVSGRPGVPLLNGSSVLYPISSANWG